MTDLKEAMIVAYSQSDINGLSNFLDIPLEKKEEFRKRFEEIYRNSDVVDNVIHNIKMFFLDENDFDIYSQCFIDRMEATRVYQDELNRIATEQGKIIQTDTLELENKIHTIVSDFYLSNQELDSIREDITKDSLNSGK